ncbi:dihydrofolate reductase family protein [Mucilaginibacter sp. UR6-11]|nr:dihydrofolate reductase family protein [Mucilaginibacter sp. UR6-11]
MNISLDGFMAGPDGGLDWHLQNWTNDMGRLLSEQLSRADTILLGRNTYSAMAGYWPAVGNTLSLSRDDLAFADMMNSYAKVVCSTTLKNLYWQNSLLISRDIRREIIKLKQQAGKDIIIYGSRKLVQSLIKLNLVDEYRLWLYPVSLGRGIALFNKRQNLTLLCAQTLSSGVILLSYGTR